LSEIKEMKGFELFVPVVEGETRIWN
jgi:hypothetical protein